MPTLMQNNTTQMQNLFTDQFIAGELLNSAKLAITSTARAITEATSSDVKQTFIKQLEDAIMTHQQIFELMQSKGWYHPHDINTQLQMDLQGAQKALNLPQ